MPRRNTQVFIVALIIFALAACVVFPLGTGPIEGVPNILTVEKGILGNRGIRLGLDLQGGIHIVYRADLSSLEPGERDGAMDGVKEILGNRINPMGVTEPLIQRQGSDRIVVELPGLDIPDKEKERLSRVAMLEFGELASDNETAKWENELGRWKPATAMIDGEEKALNSRYFKENTYVASDNEGRIQLVFEWDEEGSKLSEIITGRLIGKPLAIFDGDDALLGENGSPIAPIVQSTIVNRCVITGLSLNDATRLSNQLNAGR